MCIVAFITEPAWVQYNFSHASESGHLLPVFVDLFLLNAFIRAISMHRCVYSRFYPHVSRRQSWLLERIQLRHPVADVALIHAA